MARKKHGTLSLIFIAVVLVFAVRTCNSKKDAPAPAPAPPPPPPKTAAAAAPEKKTETATAPVKKTAAAPTSATQEKTHHRAKNKYDKKLSAKIKYQCCVLLNELLKFKGDQDFATYGLGSGGKYKGWLDRVRKLNSEITTDTPIPYEVKTAPGFIMQIGLEYARSKGEETEYTKAMMPDVKKTIGFENFLNRAKNQKIKPQNKKRQARKRTASPGDLLTASGTVYKKFRIVRATERGVTVSHENGVANVPLEELPQDLMEKYKPQVDAAKSQFEAERKKEEAERKAAAEKREAERKAAAEKREMMLKSRPSKIDAWVTTQYLVEAKLLSPKSAKFPFAGAQRHVEETTPGIFVIKSYVDSKNAYGTEVRTHFFCKLAARTDGKFEVIQLTFQ